MDIVTFSQTFFYLVVSFAVVILGIFAAIIAYHLIRITKRLEEISNDIGDTSRDAREGIKELLEQFSRIPLLSFFMDRKSREQRKKGRGKSSQQYEK